MNIFKGKTLVAVFGIGRESDINSFCVAKGDSAEYAIEQCSKKFFHGGGGLIELQKVMEAAAGSIRSGLVELRCQVRECYEILGDYFIPIEDIYLKDIPAELPEEGLGLFILKEYDHDERYCLPKYSFIAVPFGKYKIGCCGDVLEYEISQSKAVGYGARWGIEDDWPEDFVFPKGSWVFDDEVSGWLPWDV